MRFVDAVLVEVVPSLTPGAPDCLVHRSRLFRYGKGVYTRHPCATGVVVFHVERSAVVRVSRPLRRPNALVFALHTAHDNATRQPVPPAFTERPDLHTTIRALVFSVAHRRTPSLLKNGSSKDLRRFVACAWSV